MTSDKTVYRKAIDTANFSWTSIDADPVGDTIQAYQIKIGTTSGGNDVLTDTSANVTGLQSGSHSINTVSFPVQTLYWSVRGQDSYGNWGSWKTSSFEVKASKMSHIPNGQYVNFGNYQVEGSSTAPFTSLYPVPPTTPVSLGMVSWLLVFSVPSERFWADHQTFAPLVLFSHWRILDVL